MEERIDLFTQRTIPLCWVAFFIAIPFQHPKWDSAAIFISTLIPLPLCKYTYWKCGVHALSKRPRGSIRILFRTLPHCYDPTIVLRLSDRGVLISVPYIGDRCWWPSDQRESNKKSDRTCLPISTLDHCCWCWWWTMGDDEGMFDCFWWLCYLWRAYSSLHRHIRIAPSFSLPYFENWPLHYQSA